jgi:hypothetical protein
VVVEAEIKRNTKTTLRSARRAALKKDLTGPTLLEMSGLRVYQDLAPEVMIFSVQSGWMLGTTRGKRLGDQ